MKTDVPDTSRRSRVKTLLFCCIETAMLVFPASPAPAAEGAPALEWSQWGGPNRDWVSTETGWNWDWKARPPRVLWTAEVGRGYSSVALSGGRAYTMGSRTHDDDPVKPFEDVVLCLDAESGKVLWEYAYPEFPLGGGEDYRVFLKEGLVSKPAPKRGGYVGPYATPTVHGGVVYTLSKAGRVLALDADKGTLLWERHLTKDYWLYPPHYGHAGSPLVEGDLVILNHGVAGVALDARTGKTVWKSADSLPKRSRGGYCSGSSHSSPRPFLCEGRRAVAIHSWKGTVAVDPSDGRELWVEPYGGADRVVEPVFLGDRFWISARAEGSAVFRVKDGKTTRLWENKELYSHFYVSVLWKGHIFCSHSYYAYGGPLKCVDFETGEVKWSEEKIWSSLSVVDGMLLLMKPDGTLAVVEAAAERYHEVAAFVVRGAPFDNYIPVVPAGGRLYARTRDGRVSCIEVGRAEGPRE